MNLNHALPMIESVNNFTEHLRKFPHNLESGVDYEFNFACNAATRGDFDTAEAVMTKFLDPSEFFYGVPDVVTEEHRFAQMSQERYAYFLMTLRKGRSETLSLLHDWEAFSVKSMKVEKYWKPSPFPCEL